MVLTMNTGTFPSADVKRIGKRHRNGHAAPKSVQHLDLGGEGRVRVGHLLTLLGISHSTLYVRIKKGTLPAPDGKDTRPFWNTLTVRRLLEKRPVSQEKI
jgi:hypothetical protein